MAVVFSKILSPTDVTQKFTVPTEWLGNLLPTLDSNDEATICVLDQKERQYLFVLKAREIRSDQPYLKPVFQSHGWLQFVLDNELKAKDTIYFWKERYGGDDIIRAQVRDPPIVLRLFGFNVTAPI